jgi:hypothetical protein
LVADVQAFVNNPATNYGWILIGNEQEVRTVKRFNTRENLLPATRPTLVVDYTPPPGSTPAAVPVRSWPTLPLLMLTLAALPWLSAFTERSLQGRSQRKC